MQHYFSYPRQWEDTEFPSKYHNVLCREEKLMALFGTIIKPEMVSFAKTTGA